MFRFAFFFVFASLQLFSMVMLMLRCAVLCCLVLCCVALRWVALLSGIVVYLLPFALFHLNVFCYFIAGDLLLCCLHVSCLCVVFCLSARLSTGLSV